MALSMLTFSIEKLIQVKVFFMAKLSPHQALVHVMVTMSAADTTMTDKELSKIGHIIQSLPIFNGYNEDQLIDDASECRKILQNDNGLAIILKNARDILPKELHETAYALAVEVAAADLSVEQEELRLLQILRQDLNIDNLICSAIERGARARHKML